MESRQIHIGSVVLDVHDVARAARFWCGVLGYERRDAPEPGEDFVVLRDPRRAWASLSLQQSDEPKRDVNRVHLDLYAEDHAAEVRRIEALGGRRVQPWPYPPGADFVVMADPEGNEFCVVQKG